MFCVLGTRLYNFPLITQIHTDIPRIRANPWEVMLRVRLVVLLGAKVPNVLTQGLVQCLCLEGCHVGVFSFVGSAIRERVAAATAVNF